MPEKKEVVINLQITSHRGGSFEITGYSDDEIQVLADFMDQERINSMNDVYALGERQEPIIIEYAAFLAAILTDQSFESD
ncbi:MAG: hypothetical protein AAFO91_03105 [Bacteroidota bacterium]